MKLIGKGLLILTVFFVSIMFVNADKTSCNNAGGIWCSSGQCVNSGGFEQTCVISENQNVNTTSPSSNIYSFETLTINTNIQLQFYYTGDTTLSTSVTAATGGTGGNGVDGGGNGQKGGDGGLPGKRGFTGTPSNQGGPGVRSDLVGSAVVSIVAQSLINNGQISTNGYKGSDGWCQNCGGTAGCGGAGGAGGSGGGKIDVVVNSYSGSGSFSLKGAAGSRGAFGTSDWDNNCGHDGDSDGGGGGGGGAGGAGGILSFYSKPQNIATVQSALQSTGIDCSGGSGGAGGECGGEYCNDGSLGNPGELGVCTKIVQDSSMLYASGSELVGIIGAQGRDACFDNVDNDLDGYKDFEDADCYNSYDYEWSNASAPIVMFGQGYHIGDSGTPAWWNPVANNGLDAVCGDDSVGDLGYVTPDNAFLCYNNKSNFYGGTTDKWIWIPAGQTPFIITPVNYSGKIVDYISNSASWYYCNANPTPGLTGFPVNEYNSFPAAPSRTFESMECSDIATILRHVTHYDCNDVPMQYPCCYDGEPKNIFQDPDSVRACDCMADSVNGAFYCALYPDDLFCEGAGSFGEEEILKELCKQNERLCSDLSTYEETKSCTGQDFGRGLPCIDGNVCVNGVLVYPQGERCCFGDPQQNKKCVLGESITNEDECLNEGGVPYDRTENLQCAPPDQDITIGENQGCCFGVFMNTLFFPFSFFENENNNTFSCFAQESNNYFGQCCVGNCNNLKNLETINIDSTQNRIFSLGTEYNLLTSYDRFKGDISKIDDLAKRFTTETSLRYSLANINIKGAKLSFYEYIEMDVVYNRKARVGNVYINDVPYDPLWSYSTNGDQDLVPHHIKIKIKTENKAQILQSIKVDLSGGVFPSIAEFKYDNVYLTTDPLQTTYGSDNHYCTGGFAAWIPQLDSQITTPLDVFFTGADAWLDGYGRYAVTCESQWPYVWTGHYCCGDDTNLNVIGSYGEYFNDTTVPTWSKAAGCFAGIGVPDGEAVWKTRGYAEDDFKFFEKTDELKSYIYSDLLYSDNQFIGCQTPPSKYTHFTISHDGTYLASAPKLINNFTDECTVIETYYCLNGIWRQYAPGLGQTRDEITNGFTPSIPSYLELKSVPPATNLIKNGDFGGEDSRGGGR